MFRKSWRLLTRLLERIFLMHQQPRSAAAPFDPLPRQAALVVLLALGAGSSARAGVLLGLTPVTESLPWPATPLAEVLPSVTLNGLGMLVLGVFILAMIYRMLNGAKADLKSDLAEEITGRIMSQLADKTPEMQIAKQPIGVRADHPCVDQPVFEAHTKEIWQVVNGLRLSISRMEKNFAADHATRQANGELLRELNSESKSLSREVAGLTALMKQHLKEEHS